MYNRLPQSWQLLPYLKLRGLNVPHPEFYFSGFKKIDYILVNKRLWKTMRDACASKCLDLGSDHQAVKVKQPNGCYLMETISNP